MSNKDSNLSFQKLYKIGWQNKLNHQNQSCIYQNPSKKKKKKKKKMDKNRKSYFQISFA